MRGALEVMLACALSLFAQVEPKVSQRVLNEHVNIVRLSPRFVTAIRMPEAVSSVMVGDPSKFLAEHSDKEPSVVVVKPVVDEATESNMLVTTVKGKQVSFLLRSLGTGAGAVDFMLNYRPGGSFLVEESGRATSEISATERIGKASAAQRERDPLDVLLERQQRAKLPALHGARPPFPDAKGDRVTAGVSEVVDQGRTVLVLFSIVNPQERAVEILAPQVQLAGKVNRGWPIRRSRWGTSEQLVVNDYRLSRRRLGAGERADGVVVFERPNFKQSNETLFLQVAESGAIDRPALAPIGFGVNAVRKEASDGE